MPITADYIFQEKQDGIRCGIFTHFPDFVVQGVSTRLGGHSKGGDLNLALHTGDDPALVAVNRQKFCRALGLDASMIVTPEQVHADRIVYVTEADCGRGATDYQDAVANCDALMTDRVNVPLMLCYADCVPLLFVDPVHRAIAVSHAGWKGTAKKIGTKTILAMQKQFGTRAEDCLVGIAPSIGACCYEVDDYVLGEFRKEYDTTDSFFLPSANTGKYRLDLWKANRISLENIGVLPHNIVTASLCTSCNSQILFSYRKEHGKTGRIAALLAIKDEKKRQLCT